MPVNKAASNVASSSMYTVKRARDSASGRSMAQNAAMGMDNFSRMLEENQTGQGKKTRQSSRMPNAAAMHDAGLNMSNSRPFVGGVSGTPMETMALQSQALPGFSPASANISAGALNMPSQNWSGQAIQSLNNMSAAQKAMQMDNQPLRTLNSLKSAKLSGSEAAVLALRSAGHKIKDAASTVLEGIGKLSSLFESGRDGVAAIGYDRVGGTSYGKYQIASNTGTMDEFISFLDQKAPDLAKELRSAGPANTGNKEGKMPEVWRDIAARDPEGFEGLQHEFIHNKLYVPAAKHLETAGLDESKLSPAMREVLFSTAVQHGPRGAARIFTRAVDQVDVTQLAADDGKKAASSKVEEHVIKRVYSIRQEQFGSSASHVQKAVSNRLQSEMNMALNMAKGVDIG